MTPIRWWKVQDPEDAEPYKLIRFNDGTPFGIRSLTKGGGEWRDAEPVDWDDITGFGGVTGARAITESEAREIEPTLLRDDAESIF